MLSDGQIIELLQSGHISITPFSDKNLTPNGYDLCVGGVEIDGVMLPSDKIFQIPPLASFRVVSLETITLSNAFTANLRLKQKYARRGIQATLSQIDAEFFGTLTFCCFNGNWKEFELEADAPFCQIVFDELQVPALRGYSLRSGHYKNQKDKVLK